MVKYEGMKSQCSHKGVHYPHVISKYTTQHYGCLEKFCPGITREYNEQGEITEKGYFKVFMDFNGDVHTPSIFFWQEE